jgi:universal stress protein A
MRRRQRDRHMFGSILCPVDFSANSRAALRYGAALARRSHGLLVVLFVNDPLLVAAAAAAYDARALATTSERELRRFVTKALGASPNTRSIRFLTAVGKPATAIVKVARDHRCDVIVMGTQGLSGPSKWFFGSVTQAVLKRTGVPVLAIPRACRGVKAGATGVKSWPGPHIIVCRSTTPPRAAGRRRWSTKSLRGSVTRALERRDRLELRAMERVLSLLPHRESTVHAR